MLSEPQGYTELTTETATIPTFADVLWVYEYEGDSFAKTRYGCLLCCISKNISKYLVHSLKKPYE